MCHLPIPWVKSSRCHSTPFLSRSILTMSILFSAFWWGCAMVWCTGSFIDGKIYGALYKLIKLLYLVYSKDKGQYQLHLMFMNKYLPIPSTATNHSQVFKADPSSFFFFALCTSPPSHVCYIIFKWILVQLWTNIRRQFSCNRMGCITCYKCGMFRLHNQTVRYVQAYFYDGNERNINP